MAIRRLDKSQCQGYFDRVSQQLSTREARIEVSGLDIGNQTASDPAVLRGLAYDPRDDEFEVVTDTIDHLIAHPQEVYVDDGVDGLHSVQVIDGDGHEQVISLTQPLQLPPA